MARRDKGPLRPIKSGCIRTNKTQIGIPGGKKKFKILILFNLINLINFWSGKCQSGVGLEISEKKLPKHFTSSFCTIQCDSDLCDYRIAKKFLR